MRSATWATVPTEPNSSPLTRDQEDALRIADFERQRDGHAGEDDGVLDWDQGKVFHGLGSCSLSFDRTSIATNDYKL